MLCRQQNRENEGDRDGEWRVEGTLDLGSAKVRTSHIKDQGKGLSRQKEWESKKPQTGRIVNNREADVVAARWAWTEQKETRQREEEGQVMNGW